MVAPETCYGSVRGGNVFVHGVHIHEMMRIHLMNRTCALEDVACDEISSARDFRRMEKLLRLIERSIGVTSSDAFQMRPSDILRCLISAVECRVARRVCDVR